jgi:hypothetical protein
MSNSIEDHEWTTSKEWKIGETATYGGMQLTVIKVKKVRGGLFRITARKVISNPSELLKSGEWTPAHAVRIRKGKLEILR